MVGDTAVDSFLMDNLDVLKENNGQGIVFIKPWENHDIIKKIKLAEEAGAYAVGVDIDACGLVTLSMHGKKVVPKDVEALKELKASTKLPFIVKGIMTVEDAMLAGERLNNTDLRKAYKAISDFSKAERRKIREVPHDYDVYAKLRLDFKFGYHGYTDLYDFQEDVECALRIYMNYLARNREALKD